MNEKNQKSLNVKELAVKLTQSKGDDAKNLMTLLGGLISEYDDEQKNRLSKLCFSLIEESIPARQASLVYLITMCGDIESIKKLS
jgi:hypothetical protein